MPNMSYCRFENTYVDLKECFAELQDANSVSELIDQKNNYEKVYVQMLIRLCVNIAEQFGGSIEEE